MKFSNGAWLPDDEADAVMLGCGSNYQADKLRIAMKYVKGNRLAIDVGAHCGLWSMQLADKFDRVVAFEPLERHIECFRKNAPLVELHENVLGDVHGNCNIHVVETLSGRSYVNGEGDYPMSKLDDFEFEGVDFIKIDTEGFELFVLKGAEQTLLRCKPALIVEQKEGHGQKYSIGDCDAVRYLESIGAKVRAEIIGDYILSWDSA